MKRFSSPSVDKKYPLPRFRISLIKENRAAQPERPISSSTDADTLLSPYFHNLDREHFLICGVDAKHRIVGVNVVSIGSLCLSIVHPREVFKPLILMNAAAFLCAHNHPSGDSIPSAEDRDVTARLREAGNLLGITMLDHLIFGDIRYSFADASWPCGRSA